MLFLRTFVLSFGLLFVSSSAVSLTCQEVRQLAAVYLKFHYSFNEFDDELSERTLEQIIKTWDPGKLYFYKSDVQNFRKKYGKSLDDLVMAANCQAVSDIVNVFDKRFNERQKVVKKLIKSKFDFTKDEYLKLDRKKMEYASASDELDERWRKRVKFQTLQLNKTLKDIKKVQKKLSKRYDLAEKRQKEQTQDEVFARFLNAFSTSLDPHSDYMSADQLEDFRINTRLSLEGIGAILRSEDGFTVVQGIVAGGAAERSGELKVDDKIIAVAQEKGDPTDVIDMELRDVVKLIRGTGGTKVRLTVIRENKGKSKQMEIAIVREKIQLTDKTAKSRVFEVNVSDQKTKKSHTMKIGMLVLPSFYIDFEGQHSKQQDYRSSARDMLRELNKMKKENIDALVLDLRTNGGGSLTESIKVAGLFFDSGPVVQIKQSDGNVYPEADTDGKTYYDGPLLVMIGRQSASASEIFAGAIQDYQRGIIIGDDHTFGKGTVQNLNDIGSKLGAIKVTISKFYRPSGSSTQLNGVASDINLPSLVSELEIGEKHYDYALVWDKIKPTPYKRFNLVDPYVEKLKVISKKRIAKDEGYKKLAGEIEEWRKNKKEKDQVSLNEKKLAEEELKAENDDKEDEDTKKRKNVKGYDPDFDLVDDIHAQEALRIAADYANLVNKKSVGVVSIPMLHKVQVAESKMKAKKK